MARNGSGRLTRLWAALRNAWAEPAPPPPPPSPPLPAMDDHVALQQYRRAGIINGLITAADDFTEMLRDAWALNHTSDGTDILDAVTLFQNAQMLGVFTQDEAENWRHAMAMRNGALDHPVHEFAAASRPPTHALVNATSRLLALLALGKTRIAVLAEGDGGGDKVVPIRR
jgi:hypothetical protein